MIRPGTVVPVLQGPARGMKWITGSATHGCWLGSYELAKVRLVTRVTPAGGVAWDIGANVGYYTLVFSRLVGETGAVIAFEPLPRNCRILRRHAAMNRIRNVTVVEAAAAAAEGKATFLAAGDPSMGRLGSGPDAIDVDLIRLDDWQRRTNERLPSIIKIDVEGAEVRVLEGAGRVIEMARPTILCATHGAELHAACVRRLSAHDYRVETIAGAQDELVAYP